MVVIEFDLRPIRREPGRALEQVSGGLHRVWRREPEAPPPDDLLVAVLDGLRGLE